jgi:hypothetical protein
MESKQTLSGRCHCGNVAFTFRSSLSADRLPVRADGCSFCRAHGVRSTSDPNGHVQIIIHDSNQLIRYRFGLKTADFLICGRCGIYVGAVITVDSTCYAVLNINTFDSAESFTREARAVSYDGETEMERIRRRQANWTPSVVMLGSR